MDSTNGSAPGDGAQEGLSVSADYDTYLTHDRPQGKASDRVRAEAPRVAPPPPKPDKAAMRSALDALYAIDDVIELRALHKGRKRTDAGYFDGDHREALVNELRSVDIYVLSGDPPTQRARSQTDILIDIGLNVSKALFCGDDDRPYAVIRDRSEVWGIASKRFREWLRGCYFKHVGKGANSNAMRDAIETISAKAQFSGDKRRVFLRTAEADGKLYVDLTDDEWRVVEIDATGWCVLARISHQGVSPG